MVFEQKNKIIYQNHDVSSLSCYMRINIDKPNTKSMLSWVSEGRSLPISEFPLYTLYNLLRKNKPQLE